MGHFADGGVSRLHARTGDLKTHELVASQPASLVVQGDAVWVGDWATPTVVRLPTIGSGTRRSISLPALAKLAGSRPSLPGPARSGATVLDSHAVWRIDPKTTSFEGVRECPG